MKNNVLFLSLGVLALLVLAGCSQGTGNDINAVTSEDFIAACEEAGYTSSDGTASGAAGAPSRSDPSGIKIGKSLIVVTPDSDSACCAGYTCWC